MKTINYSAFILAMIIGFSSFSQEPKTPKQASEKINNINYFDDDFRFKINFFGNEPEKTITPVSTEFGEIIMTTYTYEKSLNAIYMVAVAAYPIRYVDASNPADMLDGAINGFVSKLDMSLNSTKDISINNYSGKFFTANSLSYYSAVADYIVNNVLFQIAILRTDRQATENEINNFIYSFELK